MSATTRPARVTRSSGSGPGPSTASHAQRSGEPGRSRPLGRTAGAAAQAMAVVQPTAEAGAPGPGPDAPPAPQPLRRPLTVVNPSAVRPLRPLRPARTPFVGLVVVLIVAGLMALLTLNTALQQAAFTVTRLERQAATLTDREQALAQQVAVEEAPSRLAERAAQLGMVPSQTPSFIRVADGTVLGVPTPGQDPIEVPVDPLPPTDVPGTAPSSPGEAASPAVTTTP